MTQGIAQLWVLPGSKGFSAEVSLQEQYDTLQNSSRLEVGLQVSSQRYTGYTYYLSGSVKVAGQTLVTMRSTVPTHYIKPTALEEFETVKPWSSGYTGSPWVLENILHDTDGSKTVTVEITLSGYTSSGSGGSGWSVSTTRELALTHIPRASTLAATDANIGAVSMIAITRRSTDYVHSVAWSFGGLQGWLHSDGTLAEEEQRFAETAVAFPLPESFYGQIPGSPTGVCTLTCRTYWGDTQVGRDQSAAFTVTADPDLCGPQLSATLLDENPVTVALTGDPAVQVRYASCPRCVALPQARQGAAIADTAINGQPGTELLLSPISCGSVQVSCQDSRGYTASLVLRPAMVGYLPLTAQLQARRLDPTSGDVQVQVTGRYFAGSFGAADNTLTLTCQTGDQSLVLDAVVEQDQYTAQGVLQGLDYRQSHQITLTAADRVQTLTRQTQVGKGIPVFDWGEEDFRFHVPVTAPSVNGVENLLLAAYPVGSIYLTLSNSSPADLFGGVWEKIRDRFLLAAGEIGAGDTGGEAEHTLTVEELPAHTHELPAVATRVSGTWDGTVGSANCTGKQDCRGVQSAGGGMPHNNMPPYLAVHMWQRIS